MKNKILLFLIVVMSGISVHAQTFTNTYTTMNVYFNNRPAVQYPINAIDTITYNVNQAICPATVNDTDGNIYNVVQIGSQCWMKKNLRTKHNNNGTPIASGLTNTAWGNASYPACAEYNNDSTLVLIYGRLYNGYAAYSLNLCPVGWHVPSNADWGILYSYIDTFPDVSNRTGDYGSLIASGIKEAGISHWASPNVGATNYWNFSALPGGIRNNIGYYSGLNNYGNFWTSTLDPYDGGYYKELYYNKSTIVMWNTYDYNAGYSIRCVKN